LQLNVRTEGFSGFDDVGAVGLGVGTSFFDLSKHGVGQGSGMVAQVAEKHFNHQWTRIDPTQLAPQPRILDCGGKRSATPLWDATVRADSGVAAALQSSLRFASAGCHRSPNLSRACVNLCY